MIRYANHKIVITALVTLVLISGVHECIVARFLALNTSACFAAELQGSGALDGGMNALSSGRYSDAEKIARELIADPSTDSDIVVRAKELLVLAVRWDKGCNAALQEAANLGSFEQLAKVVADITEDLAAYTAAVEKQKAVITSAPASKEAGEAAYNIAKLTNINGGRDEAITAYNQLITEYTQIANTLIGEQAVKTLRDLYYQKSGNAVTIELLRTITLDNTATRTGSAAAYEIGSLLQEQGDLNGALASYRESIRRYVDTTTSTKAVLAIRDIGTRYGAPKQSLLTLSDIQTTYPTLVVAAYALYGMAQVYESQKQDDCVYETYKKLVNEHTYMPDEIRTALQEKAKSYYRQGFILGSQGQYTEAIAEFQKVLDLKPIRDKIIMPSELPDLVRNARELFVKDVAVDTRFQKGISHYCLGQDAKAIAEFEAILKDHSDSDLCPRAEEWIEKIRDKP